MLDQYHYDYETVSYYCYPGTYILKNKLNITNENELIDAERSITSLRTAQLIQNPLDGDLDFNYLKNIHKFIFGDIYEWAGSIRTVNISKGNPFCRCEFIEEQMESIMKKLKRENYLEGLSINVLAERLAYYIGEINEIHPFREGNGRVQRLYFRQLARWIGHSLNFAVIDSDRMMIATIHASAGIIDGLQQIFDEMLD